MYAPGIEMAQTCRAVQGGEVMCEYCDKFKDNQFKILIDNRAIDASLFIDGEHGKIFWRVNGFQNGSLFAYAEINYCPMCGRKFTE